MLSPGTEYKLLLLVPVITVTCLHVCSYLTVYK